MKTYRFVVDFGDARWTLNAGSWQGAAIKAVAERLNNGLHTDLHRITCEELRVDVFNVRVSAHAER